jgi:uncharacterized protein (DUF2062 family)
MSDPAKNGLGSKIAGWAHRNMPKREDMEHNRFLGPFARRHELWRFTRRSVPRGVAIGLLVGIFALIPGVQIIGAALLCVPCRGNIPLAALMTCVSIPPTTLFVILPLAVAIGNRFGFHADIETVRQMMARGTSLHEWWTWIWSDTAPSILIGLFVQSVVVAAIGYLVASFGWAWWIGRKHRMRLAKHARDRAEALQKTPGFEAP